MFTNALLSTGGSVSAGPVISRISYPRRLHTTRLSIHSATAWITGHAVRSR